jgi:hypothetical protein
MHDHAHLRVARQELRDLLGAAERAEKRLRSLAEEVDGEVSVAVENARADVTAVAERLFRLASD